MFSHEQLRSYVERIERLEIDKAAVSEDIKEVYQEAKSNGFDTKAIKTIVALRRKTDTERSEEEAILDTYKAALGMIADLPLGQAAISRAKSQNDTWAGA